MIEREEQSKISQTVAKILRTMEELERKGIKPTQKNVADALGVTRQAVHKVLRQHEKLDEFKKPLKDKIKAIQEIDTSRLTIKEICQLPQLQGFFSYTKLRKIVLSNNIPHKETALDQLTAVDTSAHTVKELTSILEAHPRTIRRLLSENNLPYKKVR